MVRIETISISKFDNISSTTNLRFGARGVVLLGKNGTGKTTLLKLLVSLCRGDWGRLSESAYKLSFSIVCSDQTRVTTSVTMTLSPPEAVSSTERDSAEQEADFRYALLSEERRTLSVEIELRKPEEKKSIRVVATDSQCQYFFPGEPPHTENRSVTDGWYVLLPAVRPRARSENKRRQVSYVPALLELLELANQISRFDEGLGYFNALTERNSRSNSMRPFSLRASKSPAKTNDGELSVDYLNSYHVSEELAEKIFKRYQATADNPVGVILNEDNVEYLKKFCRLANFDGCAIVVDIDEHEKGERESVTLGPMRYVAECENGIISHHHLSFGERRLLGLLHYLDTLPRGPVIADELVNGLHYAWISACLEALGPRQAFLSSQNPLLFDFLEFESADDAAQRFVICNHDQNRGFVWKNMDPDDANEFWELYNVGIQHVGEILRTKNYW